MLSAASEVRSIQAWRMVGRVATYLRTLAWRCLIDPITNAYAFFVVYLCFALALVRWTALSEGGASDVLATTATDVDSFSLDSSFFSCNIREVLPVSDTGHASLANDPEHNRWMLFGFSGACMIGYIGTLVTLRQLSLTKKQAAQVGTIIGVELCTTFMLLALQWSKEMCFLTTFGDTSRPVVHLLSPIRHLMWFCALPPVSLLFLRTAPRSDNTIALGSAANILGNACSVASFLLAPHHAFFLSLLIIGTCTSSYGAHLAVGSVRIAFNNRQQFRKMSKLRDSRSGADAGGGMIDRVSTTDNNALDDDDKGTSRRGATLVAFLAGMLTVLGSGRMVVLLLNYYEQLSPSLEQILGNCMDVMFYTCCIQIWMADDWRTNDAEIVAQLQQIEEQAHIADARNDAKRKFMRYIFHELRVPLNAIVLGLDDVAAVGIDVKDDLYEIKHMASKSAAECALAVASAATAAGGGSTRGTSSARHRRHRNHHHHRTRHVHDLEEGGGETRTVTMPASTTTWVGPRANAFGGDGKDDDRSRSPSAGAPATTTTTTQRQQRAGCVVRRRCLVLHHRPSAPSTSAINKRMTVSVDLGGNLHYVRCDSGSGVDEEGTGYAHQRAGELSASLAISTSAPQTSADELDEANLSAGLHTPLLNRIDVANVNHSSIIDTIGLLISNATTMSKLLDDFLSLEKIEEGKFELEPVQFKLRPMVDDAVRLFAAPLAAKGLLLNVSVQQSVPEMIIGDVYKLRQVLCNYISNAIKFSPQGTTIAVRVEARTSASAAANANITTGGNSVKPNNSNNGNGMQGGAASLSAQASLSPSHADSPGGTATVNAGNSSRDLVIKLPDSSASHATAAIAAFAANSARSDAADTLGSLAFSPNPANDANRSSFHSKNNSSSNALTRAASALLGSVSGAWGTVRSIIVGGGSNSDINASIGRINSSWSLRHVQVQPEPAELSLQHVQAGLVAGSSSPVTESVIIPIGPQLDGGGGNDNRQAAPVRALPLTPLSAPDSNASTPGASDAAAAAEPPRPLQLSVDVAESGVLISPAGPGPAGTFAHADSASNAYVTAPGAAGTGAGFGPVASGSGAADGGPVVSGSPAGAAMIRFSVTDQGVGISHEDQAKLFQPFNQINAGALQKGNGTGLGLSICKRIVELSGGRVGVHSREGKGSTFYFQVPASGPPPQSNGQGSGLGMLNKQASVQSHTSGTNSRENTGTSASTQHHSVKSSKSGSLILQQQLSQATLSLGDASKFNDPASLALLPTSPGTGTGGSGIRKGSSSAATAAAALSLHSGSLSRSTTSNPTAAGAFATTMRTLSIRPGMLSAQPSTVHLLPLSTNAEQMSQSIAPSSPSEGQLYGSREGAAAHHHHHHHQQQPGASSASGSSRGDHDHVCATHRLASTAAHHDAAAAAAAAASGAHGSCEVCGASVNAATLSISAPKSGRHGSDASATAAAGSPAHCSVAEPISASPVEPRVCGLGKVASTTTAAATTTSTAIATTAGRRGTLTPIVHPAAATPGAAGTTNNFNNNNDSVSQHHQQPVSSASTSTTVRSRRQSDGGGTGAGAVADSNHDHDYIGSPASQPRTPSISGASSQLQQHRHLHSRISSQESAPPHSPYTDAAAALSPSSHLTPLVHAVVVDDVKSNRDFFGRMLARRGVTTIHFAEDGLQAVKLLDTLPPQESSTIQAWFLDKEMPNCDGHAAATQLRARGITVPIFGVTGNALAEDRRDFIAAGASAVVTKPVRAPDLEAALAQMGLRLPKAQQVSASVVVHTPLSP